MKVMDEFYFDCDDFSYLKIFNIKNKKVLNL